MLEEVLNTLRMLKEGLAPELGGLNEEEPVLALAYARELLQVWVERLDEVLAKLEEKQLEV